MFKRQEKVDLEVGGVGWCSYMSVKLRNQRIQRVQILTKDFDGI